MILQAAATEKLQLQEITHNPGLLIEKLNPLTTSSITWKLIQKINLKPYFTKGQQLLSVWQILDSDCLNKNTQCLHKQQLKQNYNQIKDTMKNADRIAELLQGHENQNKNKRAKRAWFSVIGKISHYLFGTLDEKSGEELKELIEIKANDTKILANLLANQTEIIQTEFGILQNKAEELEKATQKLATQQEINDQRITFTAAMELFTENIIQYEIDTETLTDAILFASQGLVHPRFIPPDQITKSAETITRMIPDAIFPIKNEEASISELIKISKLTILFSNYELIYYLEIPLLDYTNYDLYKMTPLPIHQESLNITTAFAYIWPEVEHYAISTLKDTFIPLSFESLANCKQLNKLYICQATEPVRNVNDKSACEVKLATDDNSISLNQCKIKLLKMEETFWARTETTNTWVFSTRKPEKLIINCRQKPDNTFTINKTGLLHLPSGCVARSDSIRIVSIREITTQNSINLFKNNTHLDIASLINNTDNRYPGYVKAVLDEEGKSLKGITLQGNTPSKSLKLGNDLRDIIDKARRLGEYKSVTQKFEFLQNTLSYSGIAFIVLVVLVIIYKIPAQKGGPLVLIRERLFSGNKAASQQQPEPTVKWYRDTDEALVQSQMSMGHSQPLPAINLPNIQRLALAHGLSVEPIVINKNRYASNLTLNSFHDRNMN